VSFTNSNHPASRKELANLATVLIHLIQHPEEIADLGPNEFEITQSLGYLIDSFEPER
jgi:hypothetical protein